MGLPIRIGANGTPYEKTAALGLVQGSDGKSIPLDSLAQTLGYDGSNNLTTITVSYDGNTYIQTFTYVGSNLTGISAWVKQ